MADTGTPEKPKSDVFGKMLANRNDIQWWYQAERAVRTVKALQNHGYLASFAKTREKAREAILDLVPKGATVGIGGSMTLRELGVVDLLAQRGHRLLDHWAPGLSAEEVLAVRKAQLTCDVFLTSVNAISVDGQMVSCEGVGNRLCAMTFGPNKVVIAAGVNKIVNNLEAALKRAKEIAAPQALRDTGLEVACGKTGQCVDCKNPQRGCRITLILERKPFNTDISVILIGESLGF